jgi:cation-transporting ATPase 13A3/4/5
MINIGFSDLIIVFRFADAVTWIIPPAMPIFVSMCMTYSLVRLGLVGVLGLDPQKSLVAGEVNTVCFDKTGTLTTISIDVYGYQTINK